MYRSDEYFFSIRVPKGWNIEKGINPHVIMKALNDAKNLSVSVTVQALLPGETRHQITELVTAKDITEGYIRNGARAVLLDSGMTEIWNEQAIWVNNLLSISHLGRTVHTVQYQVVTFHRGHMYSLLVGAGSDTQPEALILFERFEPEFQKYLASFAFEDWRRPDSGKPQPQQYSTSNQDQPLWPGPIENFMPRQQPASTYQPITREQDLEILNKPYQKILQSEREDKLINECLLRHQKKAKCNRSAQIINIVCGCLSRESLEEHQECSDLNRSACKCVLDNIEEAQADVAANAIFRACKGKNK